MMGGCKVLVETSEAIEWDDQEEGECVEDGNDEDVFIGVRMG